MYCRFFKRFIDIVLSFFGLIVLSPIFAAVAIGIKLDSKGPVIFTQQRVGKDKHLFPIYKFRTMRTETPANVPTHLLTRADVYITKIGGFLRKTSLDELPQLWNIFVGHMSIVGPRPVLWNQEDLIAERDRYGANGIRPGLTGWAQINGRDELETAEKARFDGEYVEKISFWFDCKCFFGTIWKVCTSDGVVEGCTGMKEEEVVHQ